MSCCSLSPSPSKLAPLCVASQHKPPLTRVNLFQANSLRSSCLSLKLPRIRPEAHHLFHSSKSILAAQLGAILALCEHPALAVTGVNNEPELGRVVIELGLIAVWYFLVMPPIIMNWLRIRWYKRKFLEMYFQFMFVFMFFPGLMLWAPFLNFRKFPRDPSLKNPWDTPQDPSKVKNAFLKYPFADPEDYA